MKLIFIEMKAFDRSHALRVIPRVAEQHPSDVPKDGVNLRH
jgi:hypothetical protein